ncbi:MAG TPA: class I SAM-dependent methyltransferase [Pseudolabrys sp.]|nr:class I SAM-dependent methyltransferase [Pseudolabrys sp.]
MDAMPAPVQDKAKEILFFDRHAAADSYDVFMPVAKARILDAFARLTTLGAGARILDVGCGTGAFTALLHERGYQPTGLDISPKSITLARRKFPSIEFTEGDAENLPFADASFDGVLLSGIVHHFPDPRRLVSEVLRVLKPGGRFMAFDPNRANPPMWLYRDHASPLYSNVGVTDNERPIRAGELAAVFRNLGFVVGTDFLAGLPYRFIASPTARLALPLYNFIDRWLFTLPFMKPLSPFVLTYGEKP